MKEVEQSQGLWVEVGAAPRLSSLPLTQLDPGHALVQVLRSGVCNTDLEIAAGYMGFVGVVGHEFVGVVVQENPTPTPCPLRPSTGQPAPRSFLHKRVCGDINLACGECGVCLEGRPDMRRNHCPHRTVLGILGKHGAHAHFLTLPLSNLHAVPDGVSDAQAVFTEPLAAACRIVEQGVVAKEHRVAVLGDGKLGLLITEVLAQQDLTTPPTLFGRHAHKLALLSDTRASTVVVARGEGVRPEHSKAFDVVVDATGSPEGLQTAVQMVKPLGTIVLKSTCAAGAQFNAAPFVIDEVRVVGSRCGPFGPALDLLARGAVNVDKFIDKVFPCEQAVEAFEAARQKGALKVHIRWDGAA